VPRFAPKLIAVLRDGYSLADLRSDTVAGFTVAIVALPLAIAIAIASGASPEKGVLTAVVAGFLISALGGSRVQIGGPTGAFIPVVYAITLRQGYDGLVLATLMAGIMLIVAGLARLGALMRYMPQPLITGFTAGIALIIFASQLVELLGLPAANWPADFLPKLAAIRMVLPDFNPVAVCLSLAVIAIVVLLGRFLPRWPGFLLALLAATIAVRTLQLPVETIGSRFGELPAIWPTALAIPAFDLARLQSLLPDAFTIAFLAGVESLLSAVVADGMTGRRHRSNTELVAQGIANCGSALCGGLPATGAIARTATNVRAGGKTPVAGILHALFLLLLLVAAGPWLAWIPLAALAGVLTVVAVNMSEHERFRHLLSAPRGDAAVLLATFLLTVLVDLTVAIEVGIVLAALLFMHRMAGVVEIGSGARLMETDDDTGPEPDLAQRLDLPAGVEVFRISGPLFFGVASRLDEVLDQFRESPRIFILRAGLVPMIDASGVHALRTLAERCRRHNIHLIISGLKPQPRGVLASMGFTAVSGQVSLVPDFDSALDLARSTS
jgi:SulP family sulfate permease